MNDHTNAVPGVPGENDNVTKLERDNPAGTCERSCEGIAYQIEIRRLKSRISELEALLAGAHEGAEIPFDSDIKVYSYSANGEVFTGEFESPEAAAAAYFKDEPFSTVVEVGLSTKRHAEYYVHGDEIIEGIAMQAMDHVGEVADSWLEDLGRNEVAKNELEKIIGDWVQKTRRSSGTSTASARSPGPNSSPPATWRPDRWTVKTSCAPFSTWPRGKRSTCALGRALSPRRDTRNGAIKSAQPARCWWRPKLQPWRPAKPVAGAARLAAFRVAKRPATSPNRARTAHRSTMPDSTFRKPRKPEAASEGHLFSR